MLGHRLVITLHVKQWIKWDMNRLISVITGSINVPLKHFWKKNTLFTLRLYIDGLVQERRNFIANALELRLFSTNPLTCGWLSFTWVIRGISTKRHQMIESWVQSITKMKCVIQIASFTHLTSSVYSSLCYWIRCSFMGALLRTCWLRSCRSFQRTCMAISQKVITAEESFNVQPYVPLLTI